jgi:hypothetical protein
MKICCTCKIEKADEEFSPSSLKAKSSRCKGCIKIRNKKWYADNTDKVLEMNKNWKDQNQDKVIEANQLWYLNNTEKSANNTRKWREGNRKKINANERERRKNDPIFRIAKIASGTVYKMLKSQGSSKNGESCFGHFPWTPEELWVHITSSFEPWMTPDNQGLYDPKTWDDTDPSTWTWQLDHIIPHSTLPYDSYDHPNFIKCWSLSNLRPLSAKQNVIDGGTKIRHKNNA